MRIAVCRPQVPFTYGGAEVVADQLVDELRIRGHEVDLIAIPYAWDRRARARPGAHLAADRAEPDAGEADRARDRDQVPLLRDPAPEQGRLARPPVPAGLRLRPRRVPAVLRVAARPGDAARRRALRQGGARRGEADLHDLRQRRRPAQALLGARRDRAAAAAAEARLPDDRVRRLRALGQPARPLQADRPADRGGEERARR